MTLNDDEARERARQMRAAQGLRIDNAEVIDEKARIHTMNKSKVFATISTNDYTLLRDYDKVPIVYIEVNENALKKLLRNPAVKIVGENNKRIPLLAQSTTVIHSQEANAAGATGAGTWVAVLDTGVDYMNNAFGTCQETQGTLVPNDPNCRVDFLQDFTTNDDQNPDDNGHGTRVSAVVVGVAPSTRILGLDVAERVFLNGQWVWAAPDEAIVAALQWVLSHISNYNISAVNMSLGGTTTKYTSLCPEDNLASLISDLKAAGVLTVAGSGNDGFTDGILSPACVPDAISVGAVYDATYVPLPYDWCGQGIISYPCPCSDNPANTNTVICWSNIASFLSLLAPGAFITAAGDTDWGTSIATPHVAGAIAAISSATGLHADNLKALLTTSGESVTKANITKPRLEVDPIVCTNSIRIGGTYYSSLQAAYNAAGAQATIQTTKSIIIADSPPDNRLDASSNKSITLEGGYDCNFQSRTGYTYVRGDIKSQQGSLTLERVVLIR